MNDDKIIELYFARNESAIEETRLSYGKLLISVAMRILDDPASSEECEDDTYMRAWESMPPTRPRHLSAFLAAITRNLALDRLRSEKRHGSLALTLATEELSDAIPDTQGDITEDIELRDALNDFLKSLSPTKRQIFMKRYFYMLSIKEIARDLGITQSGVKVALMRLRSELRRHLEIRGIVI